MNRMRLLLFFLFLPGVMLANVHKMDLSDAIKSKTVKLTAVNFVGSYTGRSVKLTITNNKKDSLNLTVDVGTILKPDDSGAQPMVLAGEESLVIAPNKKEEVDVLVFCGDSHLHCPSKNLHYSYLGIANEALIKVLRFIHDNKLFDYLGQSGVWAITNNHTTGDVYDPERDVMSRKLIDVICLATGMPHPGYYSIRAQNVNPGEVAYTRKTLKIVTPFDLVLTTPAIISAAVFDDKDHLIEYIFERRNMGKGKHRVDAMFDAEAYGAGKYTVKLIGAERTLQEKKIEVEQ